jgi:hypothetical protein
MRRRDLITLFGSAVAAWPFAAIAEDKGFTIGPAVNPGAKISAEQEAAAKKRLKIKEKNDACRKQAVTQKISFHERKAFISACEKK